MASVGSVGCVALSAACYVPFIGVALWVLPRRAPDSPADDPIDRRHPLAGMREVVRAPVLRFALFNPNEMLAISVAVAVLSTMARTFPAPVLHQETGPLVVVVAAAFFFLSSLHRPEA